MKGRLTAIVLGFVLFGALLIGRAAQLQLLPNPKLADLSKRQFQAQMTLKPKRGTIADRNGEVLAFSVETKSLAAQPQKIRNKRAWAQTWAKALHISREEIYRKIISPRSFVWIQRHVKDDILQGMTDPKHAHALEGVLLVPESRRVYPFGEVAGSLLGSVSIDNEGIEGVEFWKNDAMRGQSVQVQIQRDALGRTAWIDTLQSKRLKQGEEVRLTIDLALQFAVENELKSALRITHAEAGSVMIMDAVTGEMLALANAPGFDPNGRRDGRDGKFSFEARRNRAITDGFEPGSSVKPLMLAAALKKGMHLKDRLWGGMGQLTLQGRTIREAEAHEKFGWITLKKMIQVSSNVGAAKLALELGPETLRAGLVDFGLTQKTGIGFPGELSGWIPEVKELKPLTLANVGFGQGLFATPLQILRSYAVFANGGWLIQPQLIKSSSGDGAKPTAQPPKRILSERVVRGVNEALASVVEKDGTGTKAEVPGYKILGKTATAQVFDRTKRRYSTTKYVASFVGFAHVPLATEPAQPRLVVFVSLVGPTPKYYATDTAAPLFAKVFQEAATRYLLPIEGAPQPLAKAPLKETSPSPAVASTLHEAAIPPSPVTLDKSASTWAMPSLKGMSAREVLKTLEGHDFSLGFEGFGLVKGQMPKPGTVIAEGERIQVEMAVEAE